MKNQDNLKIDVRKFPSFFNGMKTIFTIFVVAVLFLILPNISFAATVTTFATLNLQGGNSISAIAFDISGNLYAAATDSSNNTIISKITPSGTVTTIATSPAVYGNSDSLAFDTAGNLYAANAGSNIVRKITPSGTVTTFATASSPGGIWDIAFDTAGNLYTANVVAKNISKITPSGTVTTFANLGAYDQFYSFAFDTAGNLYTANQGNNNIKKITSSGNVSTFATIYSPTNIVSDTAGNLYVVNYPGDTVSKITPSGNVSTFATVGNNSFALVFDTAGNLYTAGVSSGIIYKIVSSGAVTTIANIGVGTEPNALAFDTAGNLYTANINTISKITTSITVSSNISASWTITGPATITGSGTSQSTLGKPSGTYTITWGAVSGYVTPATQSLTLDSMGDISFSGTYSAVPPCSASISCGTTCSSGGLIYGTVVGADGNCWLDRNLGATQVATAYNDSAAYGWLFQWGRGADGHQILTSGTTGTLSSTDSPGHANFIIINGDPYDWRVPQNDNLWQGVNGINNPCPSGFRLPTQPEWAALITAASITNSATAYSSSLKLPAAGTRNYGTAMIWYHGNTGLYWSSSPNGVKAFVAIYSPTGKGVGTYDRASGYSVRCIKEEPPIVVPNCGTVQDVDGNTYNTVQIGTQCWLAENLRTTKKPDGTSLTLGTNYRCYTGDANCAGPSGNTDANGAKYGALYNWATAMNLPLTCNSNHTDTANCPNVITENWQGICPTGWHIPKDDGTPTAANELWTLENYLKDTGQTCSADRDGEFACSTAGTKLKSGGSSGFNFPLAGSAYSSGVATLRDTWGHIWTTMEQYSGSFAIERRLYHSDNPGDDPAGVANPGVFRLVSGGKGQQESVRCIKDSCGNGVIEGTEVCDDGNIVNGDGCNATCTIESGYTCTGSPSTCTFSCGNTAQDVDGNTYNTVQIGTQCWLAENLRTTKKPDGTNLTEGSGMYSNPAGFGSPWGRLYDWNTAMNGAPAATAIGAKIQGICPTGWHIPSDYNADTNDDFQKLSNFLGGDAVAGGALKKTGTVEWNAPNGGATNASNWTGYPAGFYAGGNFVGRRDGSWFLSSVQYNASQTWPRYLGWWDATFNRDIVNKVAAGFSVRCVNDLCSPNCAGTTCGASDGCGGTCEAGSGCISNCVPNCVGLLDSPCSVSCGGGSRVINRCTDDCTSWYDNTTEFCNSQPCPPGYREVTPW